MNSNRSSKGPHERTISYYQANAQRFVERTRDVDMDSMYEPFLSLLPWGAHILDAGSGSGRDSRAFVERGYEVTAGTHQGEFMGIAPTGNRVEVSGIEILRIAEGRIVELWANFDDLGRMRQLGAIPEPGQQAPGGA